MKYASALIRCTLLLLAINLPVAHAAEPVGEPAFVEPLAIEAQSDRRLYPLLELPNPAITRPVYALKGWIRYTDVEGDGHLQLDNHFAAHGVFFSKSLAPSGPLGKISGTSDWRGFVLPFFANQGDQAPRELLVPDKLVLTLYLPGGGRVWLRDVTLYQFEPGEDPLMAAGQWFGDRGAGLMGAIGGSAVGLWGGLIGLLAGRGRARGFVLGSANALLAIGIVSALAGVYAFVTGQPYAVYFPLLLMGVILVGVIASTRGSLAARYEQAELKKMQAMDL